MISLKEKVYKIVNQIPQGKFLTYKKVAELIGKPRAFRAVGNILAKNNDSTVFCHRVIRNDNLIGGLGGKYNLDWKKAALLLKEGATGVIPTDTIYGICGSAFNKKAVSRIYKLRRRNPNKPFIVLINNIAELEKFDVSLNQWQKKILLKIWPNPISVILRCSSRKLTYLHRGTNTIAFRLPKSKTLRNILSISGPLVAPSANWEGYPAAKTINEAKKYFGNGVFYLSIPKQAQNKNPNTSPSTLIDLTTNKIKILRKGLGITLIKRLPLSTQ